MKHYALSYPVLTVNFDGKYVRRIPADIYLKTLQVLKSVGIYEVMLAGYVTVEEADFDMDTETKRLGELLNSLGMKPAQHHGLSAIYAPLENPQEPVVEQLVREVQYTANLNAPVLVIHPSHYYDPDSWTRHVGTQEMYEREVKKHGEDAVLSATARNLHEAGIEAERLGVKIALENVDRFEPMGNAKLLPRLVKEADSPAVGFCLDAGHAHCCGHTSAVEWINIMGDKLFTTHFHDNRGMRLQALGNDRWISPSGIDEHRAPGFGTIPWIDVIESLREVGYANTVNFESDGWPGMSAEEGYRCAVEFWRTLENIAAERVKK